MASYHVCPNPECAVSYPVGTKHSCTKLAEEVHACGSCGETFVGLWKNHTCVFDVETQPPASAGWILQEDKKYRCVVCGRTFPTMRKHECLGPIQETFFPAIPWPESKTRYRVEWRWKPALFKTLSREFYPANEWQVHRLYGERPCATNRVAVNAVARLRRAFPGKSFRIIPVPA